MSRNNTIDLIRLFAMFFIVAIHTAPFKEVNVGIINGANINFIINTFGRFAVPLFFMVSGYFFGVKVLGSSGYNSRYFKKYIKRLLLLYLSWALFYLVYDLFLKHLQGFSVKDEFIKYVTSLDFQTLYLNGINSQHAYQLWYLVALIYSIMILHLFNKINKIKLLLVISFVLHLFGLFGEGQLYSVFWETGVQARDAMFFGLFYVTIGFFFAKDNIRIETFKPKILVLFFLVLSIVQIIERFVLTNVFGSPIGEYFLFTIPLTLSLFFFATTNKYKLSNNSILVRIGAQSVGIFLTHTFIISLIKNLILGPSNFQLLISHTVVGQLFFTPLVFIFSYLFYSMLQRLKKMIKNFLTSKRSSDIPIG